MLALATDAFGGSGGIAQYNRDLFAALAACGAARSIDVIVRDAQTYAAPPLHVRQLPARRSRAGYAAAAAPGGQLAHVQRRRRP